MSRWIFVAALLLVMHSARHTADASAFCDCCCKATAGSGAACPGCDLDSNGSVTVDELRRLTCTTGAVCGPLFPPTPTPAPPACIGDCDDGGSVTIDELLMMVNVALGSADVAGCQPGDGNADGEITVDEILGAVNNAVGSCPLRAPTATATRTGTTGPSATPTLTIAKSATPTNAAPTPTLTAPPLTPTGTITATETSPPPTPTSTSTETASATPSLTSTITHTPTFLATPTASVSATRSSPPTATPSATQTTPAPSLTRTASPTPPVTATRSATPTPSGPKTLFCDTLPSPLPIPDVDPNGVTRELMLLDAATITDVNVRLTVTHTWVGDLMVTLTHLNSHTDTVTLINRPGRPAIQNGCNGDDISVTLDDAALNAVHAACAATAPAISDRLYPENPLSAFNGDAIEGAWLLNVSDNAMNDTGALLSWCLEMNTAPPSPSPVVTDFTCAPQQVDCVVVVGNPFTLTFSFADPDRNATHWRIQARRDDGFTFDAAEGNFVPASGSGTIPVTFNPFTCSGTCPDTGFDYFVTVIDADGHASEAQTVHLITTQFVL